MTSSVGLILTIFIVSLIALFIAATVAAIILIVRRFTGNAGKTKDEQIDFSKKEMKKMKIEDL